MGLIIKDKIPQFIVGYPTVSDKYNVSGAILEGEKAVAFGDLVTFGDTAGYFKAITEALTGVDKVAGFVLGTNVKLNEKYPEGEVQVNPGEAFNLVLPGSYLAIALDDAAVETDIVANKKVGVVLATGKCTTDQTNVLEDVVFTGLYEKHGETLVAEVLVK